MKCILLEFSLNYTSLRLRHTRVNAPMDGILDNSSISVENQSKQVINIPIGEAAMCTIKYTIGHKLLVTLRLQVYNIQLLARHTCWDMYH